MKIKYACQVKTWYGKVFIVDISGLCILLVALYQNLMSNFQGTLEIFLQKAELKRDTELVGKLDPYVVVLYRDYRVQTPVKENVGLEPVFEQKMWLQVNTRIEPTLRIQVYDYERIAEDKFNSEVNLKLEERLESLVEHPQQFAHIEKLPLKFQGKQVGVLQAGFNFYPDEIEDEEDKKDEEQEEGLTEENKLENLERRKATLKDMDTHMEEFMRKEEQIKEELQEWQEKVEDVRKQTEEFAKTKALFVTQRSGLMTLIEEKKKQITRVTQGHSGRIIIQDIQLSLTCDVLGSLCPYLLFQINESKVFSGVMPAQDKKHAIKFLDEVRMEDKQMVQLSVEVFNGKPNVPASANQGKILCSGYVSLNALEEKESNWLLVKLFKIGGRVKKGLSRGELKFRIELQ